ncbi:TetR/AcrR family transcriptional regulator [Amycolatopsis sp. NBC_00345]|uniref:TetR/AcrR family transcriptional regulator n=1 Tax=Amycolatopsis sp. NBC_00345 TaxID=2975955 RepID=UPI002E26E0A5
MRARPAKPDPRVLLLDVGTRLFVRHGYDHVSIDDITAEAGLAKGLLYYYFPSKRALYVETVRAAAEELARCTTPDPGVPAAQRTAAVLAALITWADSYGEALRILLGQGAGADPELQEIMGRARQKQVDLMLAGMSDARVELGLPPIRESEVVRYAVRGWIGFIEGVLADWLVRRDLPQDQLLDLMLHAAGGALSAARKAATPETGHRRNRPRDLTEDH